MFTRFKDFFKPDSKIDKDNPRKYYSNSGWREYSQEELDENLFQAIKDKDYDTFVDMVKRGANINKIIPDGSGRSGYTTSPLKKIIYGLSSKDQYRFSKVLFEAGVEVFGLVGRGPEPYDIDIYGAIRKLVDSDYKQKTLDCFLENYPNYMEERELRRNAKKYNL